MLGLKIAQLALHYGVNDLDGTIDEEHLTHDVGSTTPRGLATTRLAALIREPVLRDALCASLPAVGTESGYR
jgi:aminodeoxyfutalosine synthase